MRACGCFDTIPSIPVRSQVHIVCDSNVFLVRAKYLMPDQIPTQPSLQKKSPFVYIPFLLESLNASLCYEVAEGDCNSQPPP